LPFVIGPQLLGKLAQVKEGDNITYRNVPIAGPQPYMGDWVNLFTGLWRSPIKNIAEEVISFAETISGAIQTPQLAACLTVARPLVKGLEKLLGMGKLELRVGYLFGFTSSEDSGPSRFRPAYFAMIRLPNANKANFWVKEDRLYFGTTRNTAEPYVDADHMLFSLRRLEEREDITTFPFYKYWNEAKQKVWMKKDVDAEALLGRFLSELAESPDFTTEHRMKLVWYYKMQLVTEKERRDAKPQHLSDSQLRDRLRKAGKSYIMQIEKAADQAGLSKQIKISGIRFLHTLIDHEIESMLRVGQKRGLTEDELAVRVLKYDVGPIKKEFGPQKLAATLRMTSVSKEVAKRVGDTALDRLTRIRRGKIPEMMGPHEGIGKPGRRSPGGILGGDMPGGGRLGHRRR
jgi:hypothetical protein